MKRLLLQAVHFVGLSGIGWILDFITFTLLGFVSKNLVLNNFISSGVGVTFVFIFATRGIFKNNSKISLKWKYIIYIIYQCVLIFFMSKLLDAVNGFIVAHFAVDIIVRFAAIISKIVITPISMVLNFFVMKGLIEKL